MTEVKELEEMAEHLTRLDEQVKTLEGELASTPHEVVLAPSEVVKVEIIDTPQVEIKALRADICRKCGSKLMKDENLECNPCFRGTLGSKPIIEEVING